MLGRRFGEVSGAEERRLARDCTENIKKKRKEREYMPSNLTIPTAIHIAFYQCI